MSFITLKAREYISRSITQVAAPFVPADESLSSGPFFLIHHMEKRCTKCKKLKELSRFISGRTGAKYAGGYTAFCRLCYQDKDRKHYLANKGKIKKRWARYYQRNRARLIAKEIKRASDNPKQMKARRLARTAVDNGSIKPPKCCTNCGTNNVPLDKHHDDYSKPLDVTFLCKSCHLKHHRQKEIA